MNRAARSRLASAAAIGLLGTNLGLAGMAGAQSAGDAVELDTITITGTKRPQADANLPMATTVLTPEDVPQWSLDPMADVARQSPGTNFMNFGRFGESYMTMRGVGTLGTALNSLDSVIGLSVDGVPTTLSAIDSPFLDVERIEVLRGPQGTTFGRNAFAGAINIVSKPPDGAREFKVDAETGSNGYGFVQGTAGGWLIQDKLAGRAAVRVQNYNGDIPNVVIGGMEGGAQLAAGRVALRYTPDESLAVDITGNYDRDTRSNSAFLLAEAPNFPASGADVLPFNRQQIASGSVKITKRLDPFIITSTSSYQDIKLANRGDFTDSLLFSQATRLPLFFFINPLADKILYEDRERIFFQEVRLNSHQSAPIQWVIGTSYFRSDFETHRDQATAYSPTLNGTIDNKITSETIAAFADATVPLGHGFDLSGGLRIARDSQTLNGLYVSNGFPGTVPALAQRNSFDDPYLTGRLALSYHWNDKVMSYVSAARGYASGGFEKTTAYAGFGVLSTPFQPAKSWTYEMGTKAELASGIRASAALFYNDVKDGQLTGFDPLTLFPFLTNQAYRSYGVEGSVSARLATGLELTAGGAWIKSRIVDVTAESLLSGVKAGNEVPQVPVYTANVALSYRVAAAALGLPGEIAARADYQLVGARYSDVQNSAELEAYHIVNSQIGWEKDGVKIYAFGRNLLDERPVSYGFTYAPGATALYVGRGRVLGLGASMTW
ncbi:TonB-dependent receptor [Chelatococcus reniformis]|uniref:TonB-dependent receptor n=1 Tax=Chelatococcus reniformis TaxID=1494448 RepID=A0A916UBR8_9HYPH|nr:TonB-dependent receptor [Chelatococcus reniformis]GGC66010.1 TonB-dependent receptor [Chelatococcus reniformis]